MNPVVVAVSLMLVLSLLRINVVVSLSISAIVGGLLGGLSLADTLSTFSGGLGGGAEIALSYAMLGAFAVAISRSVLRSRELLSQVLTSDRLQMLNESFYFSCLVHIAHQKCVRRIDDDHVFQTDRCHKPFFANDH